jgi:hypothetical protein
MGPCTKRQASSFTRLDAAFIDPLDGIYGYLDLFTSREEMKKTQTGALSFTRRIELWMFLSVELFDPFVCLLT